MVAFVVPLPGAALGSAALDAFCLTPSPASNAPKRYEIVDALPKNNYGKVLKTALRERVAAGGQQPPAVALSAGFLWRWGRAEAG